MVASYAQPTPLPPVFESKASHLSPLCAISYAAVVEHERTLMAEGNVSNAELAPIRVLGYILREDLAVRGIEHVARAIRDCGQVGLHQLGVFYTKYFIQIFFRSKGPTPTPSCQPSRPSFDTTRETLLAYMMESGSLDYRRAQALVLERDGYRDILRREYDVCDPREEANVYHATHMGGDRPLMAVHIIPEHLSDIPESDFLEAQTRNLESWVNPTDIELNPKVHKRSIMWTMLLCFGRNNVAAELAGNRIHSPENMLTLALGDDYNFDNFTLWLEPLDEDERRCRVCVRITRVRPPGPDGPVHQVTLLEKALDGKTTIPAPCPDYLRLHAACCRIALMSGAARVLKELYEATDDMESIVPSSSMFDAVSSRLKYDVSGPKIVESMRDLHIRG